MAFTLNKNDTDLLGSLAEYRVLTITQAAILMERSLRSARRRIDDLLKDDLVAVHHPAGHKSRGRPERVINLTERGSRLLTDAGALDAAAAGATITELKVHQLDHDILVSWVRLHLNHATREIARLKVRFEIPTLPILETEANGKTKKGRPHQAPPGLIPDGVFSITDTEQNKTLLFFLEVDMGTESQTSGKKGTANIAQKIQLYQTMFRSELYKRFEATWGCA